jgi:hypothetical protein
MWLPNKFIVRLLEIRLVLLRIGIQSIIHRLIPLFMKAAIFLILLGSFSVVAQTKDSTATVTRKIINDKFPSTRTFDLQYEQLGSTNNTTRVLGDVFDRRSIENHYRIKFAANIPLYKAPSKRFFVTNSFRYKFESFAFNDNQNSTGIYTSGDTDFHYFAEAVSLTYFSSLFKKHVVYNATATVDADQHAFQRIKGMASGVIVLKKTPKITFTVGLLLFLDPSSIIPIAPIATYEHQFTNSQWKLDIILPKQFLIRRGMLENGRLSLGTELTSENFYLALDNASFKGTYELNQLELHSGLTYDYAFRKDLITTFKTGITNVINSRITERGERTSNYVIDNKQDPQFYFNVGLSYNPF